MVYHKDFSLMYAMQLSFLGYLMPPSLGEDILPLMIVSAFRPYLIKLSGGVFMLKLLLLTSRLFVRNLTLLFHKICNTRSHVFHNLLPASRLHSHNLRARFHNLTLPLNGSRKCRNVLYRLLFNDAY